MRQVANVTLSLLYNEMRAMHKELHVLQRALIPEVQISSKEHRELDAILREMKAGKETNWRDAFKR